MKQKKIPKSFVDSGIIVIYTVTTIISLASL